MPTSINPFKPAGKSSSIPWIKVHSRAATSIEPGSGVKITNTEDRRMDIWTAPQAPILGVVLANATVRSERIFASPIPGVPERGPRVMHYRLKLLEILQPEASRLETKRD